jgi:hypothetical protein
LRLAQAEIGGLHEALDDEYKSWTTYDQVIHDLGPERPFINIVESEARHIEALRALFERYRRGFTVAAIAGLTIAPPRARATSRPAPPAMRRRRRRLLSVRRRPRPVLRRAWVRTACNLPRD